MPTTDSASRAERLRSMAAETRLLARDARDSVIRRKLTELADQLEELAGRLEPN